MSRAKELAEEAYREIALPKGTIYSSGKLVFPEKHLKEIEKAIRTAVGEALEEVAKCVDAQFDVETETGGEEELQAVRQKILNLKLQWEKE